MAKRIDPVDYQVDMTPEGLERQMDGYRRSTGLSLVVTPDDCTQVEGGRLYPMVGRRETLGAAEPAKVESIRSLQDLVKYGIDTRLRTFGYNDRTGEGTASGNSSRIQEGTSVYQRIGRAVAVGLAILASVAVIQKINEGQNSDLSSRVERTQNYNR